MKNKDYLDGEKKFLRVFDFYKAALAKDSVENVRHYVNVSEIEMAYESFILSLIGEGIEVSDEHRVILLELSEFLFLDSEPVFRSNFLEVAKDYLS